MQSDQNGNRRLDSWKEIASHLGRNERTAIRWEKRGLPVHRVPGGQRQAVFAYANEIDAWLISRDGKAAVSNLSVQAVVDRNQVQVNETLVSSDEAPSHEKNESDFKTTQVVPSPLQD